MALGDDGQAKVDGAISVVTWQKKLATGRLDCARLKEEGELLTHVVGEEEKGEESRSCC